MSDVLAFAGVTVRRGASTLLDDVTWEVEEGERWVVLGANGAGKTTLLQIAAARMHPSSGVAGVLGEVLGAVDVFELRPRIGLASSSMAERIPAGEPVAGLDLGGREDLVRRLGELAADTEAPAMVLVTHHVEEIPPSFTDVLMIRNGRVVAAGPIPVTLTAENLSATFGLPLVLEQYGERWSARAES